MITVQGWANYGPWARETVLCRQWALTEIQTPTVNQVEDLFLLFTDF